MLIKQILDNGGQLAPLIVPPNIMTGVSLLNPSILNLNGELLVNIRNCNYTLWHTDLNQPYESYWGPLSYLNPENDMKLKTENILVKVDRHTLETIPGTESKIEMTLNSPNPLWDFHGLEDVRLVSWNDKLYITGVRRDVKENGEGRMELSEIQKEGNTYKEVSRQRIPIPDNGEESYCEKNWMPILDMPYHFIKWSDPAQVVKFDPITTKCTTIVLKEQTLLPHKDFRGSSQLISINGYYLSVVHETNLFKDERGRKNAIYEHRFILWNDDFSIYHMSEPFSFMDFGIEFCCGIAEIQGTTYITFSCQDNAAYIASIKTNKLFDIICKKD